MLTNWTWDVRQRAKNDSHDSAWATFRTGYLIRRWRWKFTWGIKILFQIPGNRDDKEQRFKRLTACLQMQQLSLQKQQRAGDERVCVTLGGFPQSGTRRERSHTSGIVVRIKQYRSSLLFHKLSSTIQMSKVLERQKKMSHGDNI